MIVHNGNIVVNNGRWIIPPKVYNVILNQTEGGTITANPMKGINGTTVTLSTVGEIASYWSDSDYSGNTNQAYCVRLSPYSTDVLPIHKSGYSQVRLIKVH